MSVPVRRLPNAAGLPLPSYATPSSAGLDLLAAIEDAIVLAAGERAVIPSGIVVALPEGHEGQVRPRSGLAAKHGITVLNSPGTIDADYRGEIAVILANLGETAFRIERGMRIAQLVVAPVATVVWEERGSLPDTDRAEGGFGSTGTGGD